MPDERHERSSDDLREAMIVARRFEDSMRAVKKAWETTPAEIAGAAERAAARLARPPSAFQRLDDALIDLGMTLLAHVRRPAFLIGVAALAVVLATLAAVLGIEAGR